MVYSWGLTEREAEAGWYIDVERVEEADPTPAPVAVRLGYGSANTRPSQLEHYSTAVVESQYIPTRVHRICRDNNTCNGTSHTLPHTRIFIVVCSSSVCLALRHKCQE